MEWKQSLVMGAAVLMLGMPLSACGQSGQPGGGPDASESTVQTQVVSGVINRKGDFLVLLTDDGEYQVMDLSESVSLDDYSEGDSVKVTYAGELGNEDAPPVVLEITPAE